jgi:metal-dependent amidase/aminoacylase/carboxypeptidase family protein
VLKVWPLHSRFVGLHAFVAFRAEETKITFWSFQTHSIDYASKGIRKVDANQALFHSLPPLRRTSLDPASARIFSATVSNFTNLWRD